MLRADESPSCDNQIDDRDWELYWASPDRDFAILGPDLVLSLFRFAEKHNGVFSKIKIDQSDYTV